MSTATSEILRSFFFSGAEAPAAGSISIDVLDSWTNSGLTAVAPTTISWSDGHSAGNGTVVS
ncbi:MAG: hypothetical protein WBA97_17820 [Actinophytocola sp.]|uniref:hypothetical protein n=1 Tax=Actinophytocola sp. TaxID=1872138 RepID=UPI003C763258